jgi:hypothetical protein
MFVGGILGVAVALLITGDASKISGRLIAIALASGLVGDAALSFLREWFGAREERP